MECFTRKKIGTLHITLHIKNVQLHTTTEQQDKINRKNQKKKMTRLSGLTTRGQLMDCNIRKINILIYCIKCIKSVENSKTIRYGYIIPVIE